MDFPHPCYNLLKSSHRPYYIATGEFIQQSNGFRVPFYLCHILNELGFEAYVTAREQAPYLRTPLLTPEVINKHKEDSRKIIAVYTEAMWGNILHGDIVIRWILNRIGLLFNEDIYNDELFFYWNKNYSQKGFIAKELKVPCIDSDVFYVCNNKQQIREGYAYYAHKYVRDFNGDIPEYIKKHGISLCHDIPRTHNEIADILRGVKFLYCFEDSAIMPEAAACGCIVVFVRSNFTSFVVENSRFIDYILDIDDLRRENGFEYCGKAFKDLMDFKAEINTGIINFILTTQQANSTIATEQDTFIRFIKEYNSIYIYGIGLTAEVVYNTLTAKGIMVDGFIVSDEYYSEASQNMFGIPIVSFTNFIKNEYTKIGVITAMQHRHVKQVLPSLKKKRVNTFNPVLY